MWQAFVRYLISAQGQAAITPSDTADLPSPCRSVYVGTGGDLKIKGPDGTSEVYPNVPGGVVLPAAAVRVYATGTTASGLVAMY